MVGRTWCVVALLAAASLPGVAGAAAPCGRAAAERSGRWFAATPPLPFRGIGNQAVYGSTQRVRVAGIDPADPRVVVVSDGTRVQRSDDGGCSWREVYAAGPEDAVVQIDALDVAHVAGRTRVLLALVTKVPSPAPNPVRVQIVRSDDGRTGWTVAYETVGVLPLGGYRHSINVRSGAGGAAYAAVPTLAGTVGYAGSPDGQAWQARTQPTSSEGPTVLNGLAVSPWDPNELWDWGYGVQLDDPWLRQTIDGGRTWRRVDPWPMYDSDPWWSVADVAWPRRGGPARVAVPGGSGGSHAADARAAVAWSGDGGATFGLALPPRGAKRSIDSGPITHTGRGDAIVFARDGSVFRLRYDRFVPRPGDWRALAPLARNPVEPVEFGPDTARASATAPCVLLMPSFTHLNLLTVAP